MVGCKKDVQFCTQITPVTKSFRTFLANYLGAHRAVVGRSRGKNTDFVGIAVALPPIALKEPTACRKNHRCLGMCPCNGRRTLLPAFSFHCWVHGHCYCLCSSSIIIPSDDMNSRVKNEHCYRATGSIRSCEQKQRRCGDTRCAVCHACVHRTS